MFAALGEITFQVIDSPESMEIARSYQYAEHKVVEDLPRLQWLAGNLDEITMELGFQSAWTNPEASLDALIAAGEDHNARHLVLGNGRDLGWFVIEKMVETSRQLAADGGIIAVTVKLTLKEWVFDVEIDPLAPPVPATPPLGILPASGTSPVPANAGSTALTAPAIPAIAAVGSPDNVPTAQIVRVG
jgi:phage protein U